MKRILPNQIESVATISLIAINCCLLSSCSLSNGQPDSTGESVTFPAVFEDDGKQWTKSATVAESDLKLLAQYFKQNSSLAEGPLISGEPTLYTSSKGTKRFYWGRHLGKEPEWIYFQFQGSKATMKQGAGSPLN